MSIFVVHNQLITLKVCVMVEVRILPMSRILKLDLKLMLHCITGALEDYNLEEMHLQDIYKVLKQQESKVQILKDPYKDHPLTPRLSQLHKKRVQYGSLINMHVKALEKVDCEEIRKMAKTARELSKNHLTYLGQKTLFDVDFEIEYFFGLLELDSYSEERKAFAGLGLQHYLDELQKTNIEYYKISYQRTCSKKDRPPTGDLELEKETKKILEMFFHQVNFYQITFTDVDYTILINHLNVILTQYSKLIKTRLTHNKKRAAKKALAAEEAAAKKAMLDVNPEAKTDVETDTKPLNTSSAITSVNDIINNKEKEETEQSSIKGGVKPKEDPMKDMKKNTKDKDKKKKGGKGESS